MQLLQELPAIVAMFLFGVVGCLSMEWFKRRATANGRRKQKLEGLVGTVNNLRKQKLEDVTEAKPAAKTVAVSVRLPKSPVQREEEMNPSPSKARAARARSRKALNARNAITGLETPNGCDASPAQLESFAKKKAAEMEQEEREMDQTNDASAEEDEQATKIKEEVTQPVQVLHEEVEQRQKEDEEQEQEEQEEHEEQEEQEEKVELDEEEEEEEMTEEQEEGQSEEVGEEETIQGLDPEDQDGIEADAEVEEEEDAEDEEFEEESEEKPQEGNQSCSLSQEERRGVLASDWADVEAEDEEWAPWNRMHEAAARADGWMTPFEAGAWGPPTMATFNQHQVFDEFCEPHSLQAGYWEHDDDWMAPIASSGWFPEEKWFGTQYGKGDYASVRHVFQKRGWNTDGWMTPLDEFIQMPSDLAMAMKPV